MTSSTSKYHLAEPQWLTKICRSAVSVRAMVCIGGAAPILPEEARNHVGESVIVRGLV